VAKAKRVRSTPRTDSPKIKSTLEDRDLHHAEAFRDMLAPIRELWCMAEIAEEIATGTKTDERLEMTHFALYQLAEK
jgi:hypothetical protein